MFHELSGQAVHKLSGEAVHALKFSGHSVVNSISAGSHGYVVALYKARIFKFYVEHRCSSSWSGC